MITHEFNSFPWLYKKRQALDLETILQDVHKMDKRVGFATILLFCITAEAQLAPNLLNDTSFPVMYPAKILEGGEQVCPTQDQLEMTRMLLTEEVHTVKNGV